MNRIAFNEYEGQYNDWLEVNLSGLICQGGGNNERVWNTNEVGKIGQNDLSKYK